MDTHHQTIISRDTHHQTLILQTTHHHKPTPSPANPSPLANPSCPTCQICSKPGHVALYCYYRFDHAYQYEPPKSFSINFTSPQISLIKFGIQIPQPLTISHTVVHSLISTMNFKQALNRLELAMGMAYPWNILVTLPSSLIPITFISLIYCMFL